MKIKALKTILKASKTIAPGSIIEVTDEEAKKLIGNGAAAESKTGVVSTQKELDELNEAHRLNLQKKEADRIAAIKATNS
jgi:hypothetical protein